MSEKMEATLKQTNFVELRGSVRERENYKFLYVSICFLCCARKDEALSYVNYFFSSKLTLRLFSQKQNYRIILRELFRLRIWKFTFFIQDYGLQDSSVQDCIIKKIPISQLVVQTWFWIIMLRFSLKATSAVAPINKGKAECIWKLGEFSFTT